MSTIAPREWKRHLQLRCALTVVALFASMLPGWSQTAQLFTLGPTFCEGTDIQVFPIVNFNGEPFTWELQFDGLAPDTAGEASDLQPPIIVPALAAGLYDFVLTATNGDTTVSGSWPVEVVAGTVSGDLTLSALDPGVEQVVQQDGSTLFKSCASTAAVTMNFDISFIGPENSVQSWTIDWGDGSTTTNNDVAGNAISHEFDPGSRSIAFEVRSAVSGTSGILCSQVTTFDVFVGTAPEASVNVAAEELCLNQPVTEIVLGNESLTEVVWTIQFSDGSPSVTLDPMSEDDFVYTHTFTRSSCEEVVPTLDDTLYGGFYVSASVQNACDTTPFSQVGFFAVSVPPVLEIAASPASVICPNETVTLTNASTPPTLTTGNQDGCTEDYTFFWELDANVTLLSGGAGSNNGSPGQPDLWDSGDDQIEVTSSVLGAHEIKLISYSNTACLADTESYVLNVAAPGVLTLDTPSQVVCAGVPVADFTFDVSPDDYTLTWTVLDADSNAVSPGQIQGIDVVTGSGVDMVSPSDNWTLTNTSSSNLTVLVEATVPCASSAPLIHEIVVKPTPDILAMPPDTTICSGLSPDIQLSVNTNDVLMWSAEYGDDIEGETETEGSDVLIDNQLFNTGDVAQDVVFTVHLDSAAQDICPYEVEVVTVTVLPGLSPLDLPDLTLLQDAVSDLCPGDSVGGFELTDMEQVQWSWENSNVGVGLPASGQGNLPSWTATNPSTEAIEAVITIAGQIGTCDPEELDTVNVTVFPTPQAAIVVSPNGGLSCIDSVAVLEWDILTNDTQLKSFEGGSVLTEDIVNLQLDTAVVDAAATYTIEFINFVTGCMANQEIVVNPIDDIAIADVIPMNPLCFEEATGLIEVLVEEDGPVEFAWSGPSPASTGLATDLLAGDYMVVVTNEVGCQDTASVTLFDPDELVVAVLDVVPSECGEANGYVIASSDGGSGTVSQSWLGADSVAIEAGIQHLLGIDGGVYTFRAEDENGCVSDTTVNVECIPLPKPLPSEFISPNGDGKNDRWTIENIQYFPNATIQVFNRWGIEVFQNAGAYDEEWDGTYRGGRMLPSATYFYVIDTKKKSQRPFNGYLELQTNQP